jgi:toxin ParE1/3/4
MPRRKSVKLSDDAQADLVEIGTYIAQDSPRRSLSFIRELRRACMELSEMAERFAIVGGKRSGGLRRRPRGSYGIYFEVGEDHVTVIRILNAARDLGSLLGADD